MCMTGPKKPQRTSYSQEICGYKEMTMLLKDALDKLWENHTVMQSVTRSNTNIILLRLPCGAAY